MRIINKTEYYKSIKQQIKGLPIEEQLNIIEKGQINIENMQKWLKEIQTQLLKNYTYCNECGKYSKTKDFKILSIKEINQETIYTDCGYGDDDTWGNVEYIIEYQICPLCNHKNQIKKQYLRVLDEFDRWGNKVN